MVSPLRNHKVVDDRGRTVYLAGPPQRVVSLVPSDTYMLFKLGVGSRVVGRTRYCVEPQGAVESIPEVGGTKDCDVEKVLSLEPDLVLCNQEENTRRDVERLEVAGLRVFVSFPRRVASGLRHLARLVAMFAGAAQDGEALVKGAYRSFKAAEAHAATREPVPVFVPIWADPLMTIHDDTYIADTLALAGAVNVFGDRTRRYPLSADLGLAPPAAAPQVAGRDVRYPRIRLEEVVERAPALILLPDEPHPFSEADAQRFRDLDVPAAHNGQIRFCDGKDLMWPGLRSLEGLERLCQQVDEARLALRAEA